MNISFKDISLDKIAKNTGDITDLALGVYKDVLNMNYMVAEKVSGLVGDIKASDAIPTAVNRAKTLLPRETVKETVIIKEKPTMKKSYIFAAVAFLAAVAAALVAVAMYLKKKEENLAEYEEMLYNEDYLADYMPKDEECCCDCEEECEEEVCEEECCCCEEATEDEDVAF